MANERGKVERLEQGWAWVKAKRSNACSECGSRDHCHIVGGGDQMVVKAQNSAQAKIGDEVELYLSTKTKLKCTAIVYLIPVLGIFLGAFSANPLSNALGFNPSLGIAVFTITGLVLAVFLMRYLAKRMASKQMLTPIITRVLIRAPSMPVERM